MLKKLFIIVCIVVIASGGVFAYLRYKKPVEEPYVAQEVQLKQCSVSTEGVISQINITRGDTLLLDQSLVDFANHRLSEVFIDFSHNGFREYALANIRFDVGENLAKRYCSDQDVINAWLNSPSHKENMLDERFDHIGVAQGKDSKGALYVVAIFGDLQ